MRHGWWGRITGVGCALLAVGALGVPTANGAQAPGDPPKVDVQAAERALTTQQVYRAPGSIAHYDTARVTAALAPNIRVLVAPPTGILGDGHNYASSDQYGDQVQKPLDDWAEAKHLDLIEVVGLDVQGEAGENAADDLPSLRTQIAYQDVTDLLVGMIQVERNGHQGDDSPPAPTVAPTAARLAPVLAGLRAGRVYTAPGQAAPTVPATLTGFTFRVAVLPPVPPGQPFVDYAPALAKQFPRDDVFVSYGSWLEVAGPHQEELNSAREYLLGEYQSQIVEWGIGAGQLTTLLLRHVSDLTTTKQFSRPVPPPFQLRNVIAAIAPWLLLGSAVLLAGYSLLSVRRRKAAAERAKRVDRNRESGRAAAAIATLSAKILTATGSEGVLSGVDGSAVDAASERQQTASTLFRQARTADAMRRVRDVAEAGQEALR